MSTAPFTIVLGIAQDAGYPSAGCNNPCCARAWENPDLHRNAACLAIVNPKTRQRWMIDCTPDFRMQLRMLNEISPLRSMASLDGILLTHAHVGHYSGLMHLGREVLGANGVPVYAMPRMRSFLENNAPWNQLIRLENIELLNLAGDTSIQLCEGVQVTPFEVPHRGEHSETIGFRIDGSVKSAIYIPDIDCWEDLEPDISAIIADVDVAYLDGTFFSSRELEHRCIEEIPHPTIEQSIGWFSRMSVSDKNKIRFLHLNHTNPAMNTSSSEVQKIIEANHSIAVEGERYTL